MTTSQGTSKAVGWTIEPCTEDSSWHQVGCSHIKWDKLKRVKPMTTKNDSTAEILKEFDSVFRKAPIDYYFYDSPFYESECGKKVKIFIAQALQRQRESDMQAFEEIIGPDNPMVGLQTIVAQNELRAELRQKLKGMK